MLYAVSHWSGNFEGHAVWSAEFRKGFASSTFEGHDHGLLVLSTFTESWTKCELRRACQYSPELHCPQFLHLLSFRTHLGPLCPKLCGPIRKERNNKTNVNFPVTPFKQEDADITSLDCILNLHLQEFSYPYRFIVALFYTLSFIPFVSFLSSHAQPCMPVFLTPDCLAFSSFFFFCHFLF